MTDFNDIKEVALEDIGSLTEAIALTVKASGMSPEEVSGLLNLEIGHFRRMLNKHDARYFPPDLLVPLMQVCKSLLPLEWLAYQMGYALHDLTLRDVLVAIKDALMKDGKTPKFLICGNLVVPAGEGCG